MSGHGLLIYGAGNCEIAGALENELDKITELDQSNLMVFARGYLFNSSCMAMYRRFKDIKEKMKEISPISQGGIHEYYYNGMDAVKTCELKIQSASKETFEDFLNTGFEKLGCEEVILILLGQGNRQGMFLDFSQSPPTYMPYEEVFETLSACIDDKVKRLSLIVDVSSWHNIDMPLALSKHSIIDSLFVYERDSFLNIFPVCRWAKEVFKTEECHWTKTTCQKYKGYFVDPHPVWWEWCKEKWEEYSKYPSAKSWVEFNRLFQKVVIYKGFANSSVEHLSLTKKKAVRRNQLAVKDIKEYFNEEYLSEIYEEDVERWLSELKICTDFYK